MLIEIFNWFWNNGELIVGVATIIVSCIVCLQIRGQRKSTELTLKDRIKSHHIFTISNRTYMPVMKKFIEENDNN